MRADRNSTSNAIIKLINLDLIQELSSDLVGKQT